MIWTREMDAWIARECEGLEVEDPGDGGYWYLRSNGKRVGLVATYFTDPDAAIRAAEAWQAQDEDNRRVEITWISKTKRVELCDYTKQEYLLTYEPTVSAALSQALLKATGWPG